MKITSSAFNDQGDIPKNFTCEGANISPPLEFSDIPENTKSLALTVFDPDIPQEFKDSMNIPGWDHWQIWNIKPNTSGFQEGQVPSEAIQGKQTGGDLGYTGPCPPKDKEPPKHSYVFTLYALDIESLDLAEGATRVELEAAIKDHIVEKATLTGFYEKEN